MDRILYNRVCYHFFPTGAQAMLEDEIMARRSFWRRQRDREQTLTLQEFDLALQILFNVENVQLRKVECHYIGETGLRVHLELSKARLES